MTRSTGEPGSKAPRPRRRRDDALDLDASLWLTAGGRNLGGAGRIGLLQAIAEQGSITQAAKAFGMSYKAAWDAVDAMNNAAGAALVERVSGGRGGGYTRLTERGARLVERYGALGAAHRRFLALLAGAADPDTDFSLLQVINMKTSAGNQWLGSITALRSGAVNDEVELAMPSGQRVVAIIPHDSSLALDLRAGQQAIVLIKASDVVLATDLGDARVSTRNRWRGVVSAVTPGAVNAVIELSLEGGGHLVATITQGSVAALALAPGVPASALVKASDVIVAVLA